MHAQRIELLAKLEELSKNAADVEDRQVFIILEIVIGAMKGGQLPLLAIKLQELAKTCLLPDLNNKRSSKGN